MPTIKWAYFAIFKTPRSYSSTDVNPTTPEPFESHKLTKAYHVHQSNFTSNLKGSQIYFKRHMSVKGHVVWMAPSFTLLLVLFEGKTNDLVD